MENISGTISLKNTFSSSTEELPSKVEGIALCSTFIIEAVLIVVGNLLTIVLFLLNQRLRKKSLFLVINMAVADLILGAAVLSISFEVDVPTGKVGGSLLFKCQRHKLPRGVWGHAPPENFEI